MVKILGVVLTEGFPVVQTACAEALSQGVHSADVILNILSRRRAPEPPPPLPTSSFPLAHASMLCWAADELGYLPFAQSSGQLLFYLVSKRHEQTSVIVTTNLALGEWPTVFGDAKIPPHCSAGGPIVRHHRNRQ